MKTYLALIILNVVLFKGYASDSIAVDNTSIKWVTIEEALANHEKSQKSIFIDMYTDWCGWCKVMDKKTFTDPKVIEYFNKNFVAVKFNAEQKETIEFRDQSYEYVAAGRGGINKLAYVLMGGQASYPSFVLLDAKLNKLGMIAGYKTPEPFLQDLEKIMDKK